jgi:hypothetical protein
LRNKKKGGEEEKNQFMALSANSQNSRQTSNSGQTWAQVARNNHQSRPNRVSLLHTPPSSPTNTGSSSNPTNVIRTRLYRNGRNDGSFFIDVSSRNEGDSIIFKLILQQYPTCRGSAPFRDGGRRYIEVNLDPKDTTATSTFTSNGLSFDDGHRILPSLALPDRANLKRITLSRMPFLSKQEILFGLNTTLKLYGQVIDVGIITDPISGMYLGSGYAVIDTTTPSNGHPYPPLIHNLPWPGLHNGFLATCEDMKNFCKYCHKDGHIRDNCPVAPPLRLCYNCNRPGHIALHCPSAPTPTEKKQPSTPSSPTVSTTSNVTPAISPIDMDFETPILTSGDTQAPQHDDHHTTIQSSESNSHHQPSNNMIDDDYAEINQAVLLTDTSNTVTNQSSSSIIRDGSSQTPEELSPHEAQDFTLFPDNHTQHSLNSPNNTPSQHNVTSPTSPFIEERSFLQEHNTSSSKKKARITTESLHERLDRLAAPSTPAESESTIVSSFSQRRSDRLSQLTPINYDENKLC